jgi:hypothetical protein
VLNASTFMQVLIIFIYAVLLYVIMAHIARNLSLLREQLQQIQTEGVHMMQNAVHTKYTMFRLGPNTLEKHFHPASSQV